MFYAGIQFVFSESLLLSLLRLFWDETYPESALEVSN